MNNILQALSDTITIYNNIATTTDKLYKIILQNKPDIVEFVINDTKGFKAFCKIWIDKTAVYFDKYNNIVAFATPLNFVAYTKKTFKELLQYELTSTKQLQFEDKLQNFYKLLDKTLDFLSNNL